MKYFRFIVVITVFFGCFFWINHLQKSKIYLLNNSSESVFNIKLIYVGGDSESNYIKELKPREHIVFYISPIGDSGLSLEFHDHKNIRKIEKIDIYLTPNAKNNVSLILKDNSSIAINFIEFPNLFGSSCYRSLRSNNEFLVKIHKCEL